VARSGGARRETRGCSVRSNPFSGVRIANTSVDQAATVICGRGAVLAKCKKAKKHRKHRAAEAKKHKKKSCKKKRHKKER
jgi:hypothetical protein